MTTMTTIACVRGCTIAGQHATECDGICQGCERPGRHRASGPGKCDGRCRGCLPRPAEIGALCWWCVKRLRETLAETPALATWLREAGAPLARFGQTSGVKGKGDAAETVPMHAAWLEADELDAEVASWALALVEEHPVRMAGHKALGLHPAEWLDRHHETLATMGFVEEVVRALTRAVATLKARFPPPWAVEPERQVHIPCPRCGHPFSQTRSLGLPATSIRGVPAAPAPPVSWADFMCECGVAHPGTPNGARGCGASYTIIRPTSDT